MSPIKVMHVIGSLDLGGAEKLTKLLLENMDPEVFDVSVCCLKAGGFYAEQLSQGRFRVQILLGVDKHAHISPMRLVKVTYRLWLLLRREMPAIVHSHLFLASVLARVVGIVAGVRCHVVTLHRVEYPGIQRFVEWLLEPIPALFVTDSRAAGAMLVSRLGAREDRVKVIHNGIDIAEFAAPSHKGESRRCLTLGANEFVIGVIAHLYAEKGHVFLFEALARMRHRLGEFRLLVVGEGSERRRLEELARRHFPEGEIVFLGQRGDLSHLLAAMDLVVLPSSWEGFGLVLAEAMYMRVPVIATSDGGGCKEVVEEGAGGMLVPYGDVVALGTAIYRYYADVELRITEGARGRARVERMFVASVMAKNYEKMYQHVLARYRRG